MRNRRKAFSLPELLVTIAIIAILLAILFPAIRRARQHSQRTLCASNLRQLGAAFYNYAAEQRGYLPRYASDFGDPSGPVWVVAILPYIRVNGNWQWNDLPNVLVLQCPTDPTESVPTAFVLNCFAFETAPHWRGAGPLQVAQPKRGAEIPWLLETPRLFNTRGFTSFFDDIFFEPAHIVRHPAHLPGGEFVRINPRRHVGETSNVLYLDGHVDAMPAAAMTLQMFDDGVRNR